MDTVTCSNCINITSITGFPNNVIPLWEWDITLGSWSTTGINERGFLGTKILASGSGINITETPGESTISTINSPMFTTTGTGEYWPFGYPQNTQSTVALSYMVAGCTSSCVADIWEFSMPASATISKFGIGMGGTADASGYEAMALYDASRTLVAACSTGQSLATASPAVLYCPLDSNGTYTLNVGTYFLAMVDNSTTATFQELTTNIGPRLVNHDATQRDFYVTGAASLSGSTFTWASTLGTVVTSTQPPVVVVLLP